MAMTPDALNNTGDQGSSWYQDHKYAVWAGGGFLVLILGIYLYEKNKSSSSSSSSTPVTTTASSSNSGGLTGQETLQALLGMQQEIDALTSSQTKSKTTTIPTPPTKVGKTIPKTSITPKSRQTSTPVNISHPVGRPGMHRQTYIQGHKYGGGYYTNPPASGLTYVSNLATLKSDEQRNVPLYTEPSLGHFVQIKKPFKVVPGTPFYARK